MLVVRVAVMGTVLMTEAMMIMIVLISVMVVVVVDKIVIPCKHPEWCWPHPVRHTNTNKMFEQCQTSLHHSHVPELWCKLWINLLKASTWLRGSIWSIACTTSTKYRATVLLTLSLLSSKSPFSQPFKEKMHQWDSENLYSNHLSSE